MKRFFVAGKWALGAALVLTSAGARLIAADVLPKADIILDKAIEVTGGKAAYQKVHSKIESGSMEINGMKGTSTMYKAEPDKAYTEIVFAASAKCRMVRWQGGIVQFGHTGTARQGGR